MSIRPQDVEVAAVPVGHHGARVEIEERAAQCANGWLGVLVLFVAGGCSSRQQAPAVPDWR